LEHLACGGGVFSFAEMRLMLNTRILPQRSHQCAGSACVELDKKAVAVIASELVGEVLID
jgi:hypothetical protein